MFATVNKMEIRGETLAYRTLGEGERTLVLVHGNMSSSQHFDLLAEALKGRFKLILPDLRGFGASSYNEPVNALEDFARDVKAMLDALGVEKFDLLGWSTGGGIAMVMAGLWPEAVEKLYLMEAVSTTGYPMFKKDAQGQAILTERLLTKAEIAVDPVQVAPVLTALENKDKEFYRFLWNAAIYTAGNQPKPDHYEVYLADMLTQRNLVDVDYALVHFNISDRHNGVSQGSALVKAIQCPVTVFQGEKDIVVPMSMAEEICGDIGQAQLICMEGAGHNPIIDRLDLLLEHIQ